MADERGVCFGLRCGASRHGDAGSSFGRCAIGLLGLSRQAAWRGEIQHGRYWPVGLLLAGVSFTGKFANQRGYPPRLAHCCHKSQSSQSSRHAIIAHAANSELSNKGQGSRLGSHEWNNLVRRACKIVRGPSPPPQSRRAPVIYNPRISASGFSCVSPRSACCQDDGFLPACSGA